MERFENVILNIEGVRRIIIKHIESKESEKLLWQIERRMEIEKKCTSENEFDYRQNRDTQVVRPKL